MNRIRVLHLIEGFYTHGGAELLLAQALPRMVKKFDLRVCALAPPEALQATFRAAGIDTAILLDERSSRWSIPRCALRLRRELIEHPVDVIHTHLFHPTVVGRLAKLSLAPAHRPALVTSLHSVDYSNLETQFRGHALLRKGFDLASAWAANDAIVAVSEAVAADFRMHLGARGPFARIEVIHNAMDIEALVDKVQAVDPAAARRRWGWKGEELAILSIGRIAPEKNYALLVEAIEELRRRGIAARALVLGEGAERAALQSRAGDAVVFHGIATRDEISEALAACDVYCQPSTSEAFGLAILEAMAAARPVVASAVGGIPEVVADGETGLLVRPRDRDALAAALERIFREPERGRSWGVEGRARARRLFGIDAWVRRTAELYDRVAP